MTDDTRAPGPVQKVFGRYMATTAVAVAANLTIYLLLARRFGLWEPVANLVAALTVIGPRFLIHKLWVWRHSAMSNVGREASVHVGLTAAGLVLSTVVAAALGRHNAGAFALGAGNVAAFGTIWLVRFYISHVYLFTPQHTNTINGKTATPLQANSEQSR